MSWNLFKVNMLMYMNNPRGVVAFPQYAAKLALEYDMCMRRGGELISKNPVMVGNPALFTQMMTVAHLQALGKGTPSQHAFLKDVGQAVKAYWTGATLIPFPVTPIPASGAVQNLIINQALVTDSGKWPNVPFEIPTKSSLTFINAMVLFMQIHLLTLKGLYFTTSLYPSAPSPIAAPGVVNWTAYTIPNIPFPGLPKNNSDDDLDNLNVSIFPPIQSGQQSGESADIDNNLASFLSSTDNNEEKIQAILDAELQKDRLGNERFFTEAERNLKTLAEIVEESKAGKEINKSLAQIREELIRERDKCCVDCR